MIRAIAIDDEPVALHVIEMHAQQVDFIDLEKTFTSARAALNYLADKAVDLVFLDINMPDMGGFEFAALIDPNVQIVFTTAHSQYAVKGFDINISDFLLKPISYARFLQACERVRGSITSNDHSRNVNRNQSLFLKDGYNWVRVMLNNLLYIKTEDNYLQLVEPERETLVRMTVQDFLNKVPAEQFLRVHKSFVINTAKVERVEGNSIIINNQPVPVSKTYFPHVKQFLSKP